MAARFGGDEVPSLLVPPANVASAQGVAPTLQVPACGCKGKPCLGTSSPTTEQHSTPRRVLEKPSAQFVHLLAKGSELKLISEAVEGLVQARRMS